MKRKEFIAATIMSAMSVSTFGSVKPKADAFEGDCETTNDILGPFYRPNAPTRADLTAPDMQGTPILLKGTVYAKDCTTPLKDALVEIWHCSADGAYDNESNAFMYRAKWSTDSEGLYAFKTILPGKYLNGKLYRPAHIHFRVTAPKHKELVSQLYFEGDPHITKDPWASKPAAQLRILPIILEDTKGNLVVNFDIYLG